MQSSISTYSILGTNPRIYSKYTKSGSTTGITSNDKLVLDTQNVCRLYVDGWQISNKKSIIPTGFIENQAIKDLVSGPNCVLTYNFPYIQFLMQNISSSFQETIVPQKNITQGFTTFIFGAEPPMVNFSGILLNTYVDNWSEMFMALYYYFLRASRLAELSNLNATNYQVVIAYQNKVMKGSMLNLQKQTNAVHEQGVGFNFQFLLKELSFNWSFTRDLMTFNLPEGSVDSQEKQPLKTITTAKMVLEDINDVKSSEVLETPTENTTNTPIANTAVNSNPYDGEYRWPTPTANRITGTFGEERQTHTHQGVDVAVPLYSPIVSADGGVVSSVREDPGGYGKLVMITHPDGSQTLYAHLSDQYVKKGQVVERGQIIASSGSTGLSSGPHLHFEVRKNGQVIDPATKFSIPKT